MWSALRSAIVGVFRDGPELLAERIDRWLLRRHWPFDVAGDGSGPSVCPTCKKAWPCDEFIDVDRRIDRRINSERRTV